MKRIVSVWLPHWRIDLKHHRSRDCATPSEPLVLISEVNGINRLTSACPNAQALGLRPPMTLTDACALVPTLKIIADNSIFAAKALAKLANWATRFTPWVAINGTDGLWLDITGCSDLFGGEGALLDRLRQGLARFNVTAHVAVADTAGAAWAMTHFTTNDGIPPSKNRASLTPLPVAALRLEASIVKNLKLMGLSHIGDLLSLPRASLSERFGDKLLVRLDQALGVIPEPISPRQPISTFIVRHAYTEPVTVVTAITHTLDCLLLELCRLLKKRKRGVRQAVLSLFQANNTVQRIAIGTNRKIQEPKPLAALFTEHLKSFSFCLRDGSGIEIVMLAATVTEHLEPTQLPLKATEAYSRSGDNNHMLVDLVDRLANRLTGGTVARFTPHQSHVPERAVQICTSITQHLSALWPINLPRPIHLFTPPIPIEAVAMIPDNPPVLFRWQKRTHRVANASGPERITGEWWRGDSWTRDYYQIEDMAGAHFWLYREGLYQGTVNPRWWLHGLFA